MPLFDSFTSAQSYLQKRINATKTGNRGERKKQMQSYLNRCTIIKTRLILDGTIMFKIVQKSDKWHKR